jgi:SAM-dependent methyltransferase
MLLNLGCCDDIRKGFINVDICPPKPFEYDPWSETTIMQADLSQPWPWEDSTVDFILARDIIEHLPDKIFTMNEIWRVLKPGGKVYIEVPTTNGMGAFQDPTHVSFWNEHSFWYVEKGNPYRERFAQGNGTVAAFRVGEHYTTETSDGPKFTIQMEAIKE